MKLNLRIFAFKLAERIAEMHISSDDRTLLSARLLTAEAAGPENSAVYIGTFEDLAAMPVSKLPRNLICVGRGSLDA